MIPHIETVEEEIRDEHLQPRDQFVRQVDEESRSADEVLAEQRVGQDAEAASRLFVP